MEERKDDTLLKAGVTTGVMVGVLFTFFAMGILLGANISETITTQSLVEEKRRPTLVVGDADPGDNSGFFYFMIYPHQGDPGTAYASNLSNASAYEYSDSGNASCTGETPYSTTFDIVVKVGVTDEDGYYTGNGTREPGWNWCLLTCADLGISADTNMTEQFIGNTTSYAWYHYYLNNGGSGYTIIEGESFNVTSVKFYVQRIV